MDKVTKAIDFEFKAEEPQDDGFFRFRGFASTFGNVDLGGDIIESGAFDSIPEGKSFPLFLAHDSGIPLGDFVTENQKKGLFIRAKMPLDDTFVRDRIIPQMKAGSLKQMSVGFMVKDFRFEDRKGRHVRVISGAELFETSLTAIPMNPKANVTALKEAGKGINAEQARKMSKQDFEEMLGQYCPVTNKAATILASRLQGDPEPPEQSDSAWLETLTSAVKDLTTQVKRT